MQAVRCFMDSLNFVVLKNTINKYFSFSKVFGKHPFSSENLTGMYYVMSS